MSVVPERGRPKTNTGRQIFSPAPATRVKKSCAEGPHQVVDEKLVLRGAVVAFLTAGVLERQGVCLAQAVGRPRIVATGVQDMGQSEQQASAGTRVQLRIGQPLLQGRTIAFGQSAAEQGRQPRMGQRVGRLQLQCLSKRRLGGRQIAQFLL